MITTIDWHNLCITGRDEDECQTINGEESYQIGHISYSFVFHRQTNASLGVCTDPHQRQRSHQ